MPLSINSVWFSHGHIFTALLLACAIIAMIFGGVPRALGQGPTGRDAPPANKKPAKKTSTSKRPTSSGTKPQSRGANSSTAASPTPFAHVKTLSGIDLVWIPPGGSLMMGSEDGEADEKPVHRVTFVVNEGEAAQARLELPKAETDFQAFRRELAHAKPLLESKVLSQSEYEAAQTRYNAAKAKLDSLRTETGPYGFYIGKYEVTQAQWQAVMGNNPSYFKEWADCPVESVSWNEVQEFLDKLNDRNDGFRYRLPTEAEWEYACRAGTDVADHVANVDRVAWYEKNSAGKTHPVGQRSPNQFQLHDMQGNVEEWCLDWYHTIYNGAPTDGSAWLTGGDRKYRVMRGGSWIFDAYRLREARRAGGPADYRSFTVGFRVVAVR